MKEEIPVPTIEREWTADEPEAISPAAPPPVLGPLPGAKAGSRRVDLLLLLMTVIWGINFTAIKIALEDFHPLSFNALRFTMASVLLLLAGRGQRRWVVERHDLFRLMALGVLANCVYQILFIEGINLTLAGNTALIFGAAPVFTALLSAWRGHERLGARSLLGVVASFLGVSLIVLSSHRSVNFSGTLMGDLLILSCTLLWSIYTVGLRPLIVKYGYMECTRIAMISGALPLIAISTPWLVNQPWGSIRLAAWSGLLFSGAGAIALCYAIWNYAVRRLGNTRTSAYSNLTPVIGLLVAWAVLSEHPVAGQLVGMGAIFAGIYLTRSDQKNIIPQEAGA